MKGQEWESTQLFSIEHQVPTQGAQAAQKIGAQIFFESWEHGLVFPHVLFLGVSGVFLFSCLVLLIAVQFSEAVPVFAREMKCPHGDTTYDNSVLWIWMRILLNPFSPEC